MKKLERILGISSLLMLVSICMAGAEDCSIWINAIGFIGLAIFTPINIKTSLIIEAINDAKMEREV